MKKLIKFIKAYLLLLHKPTFCYGSRGAKHLIKINSGRKILQIHCNLYRSFFELISLYQFTRDIVYIQNRCFFQRTAKQQIRTNARRIGINLNFRATERILWLKNKNFIKVINKIMRQKSLIESVINSIMK